MDQRPEEKYGSKEARKRRFVRTDGLCSVRTASACDSWRLREGNGVVFYFLSLTSFCLTGGRGRNLDGESRLERNVLAEDLHIYSTELPRHDEFH